VSHLSTLEPPGWHRAGWGFRITGTVLPAASLAVRRSSLARAAKNGLFWPVLGCFLAVFVCCGDRSERSETSAISAPWNPPGGTELDGAF
ncbi:unnamed protein product, partial [Musa textilis]